MRTPPRSYPMAHTMPLVPRPSRLRAVAELLGAALVLLLSLVVFPALVFVLAQP